MWSSYSKYFFYIFYFYIGVLSREKIEVEVNLTMTLDKSFAPATYPTIDFGNSTTLHETMLKTESNATNCESCNVSFMECGKET